MGSIDIPPFMKEKMKQDIQAKRSDIPPFLQKKNGGEDVTTDLQVGADGQLEQSVPTTLQSALPENDYSFDPLKGIVSDKVGQPIIQQQNGNVLSINTKTIPITPYSNSVSYVKDLQQRINTGNVTKQDEDFLNKNQRSNQNFDAIDDSELMSLVNKYAPEITINENTDRLVVAKQLKDQVYDRFNKRYEGAEAVPDLDETSKKEIERVTELEKKLSFEKNKSETYPTFIEASIRTDESGNLWNKFTNRVLSAFPTTAAAGAAGIMLEAVDTKQKLPTEFSIGLNGLKYTEPTQFERVTNSLLKGEPLSESMVAQITAQGLEAKEAMNKDAFVNEDIDKEQYEKQANEIQVSRYENIVNNKETLRAFISSGIANIADDVNVAKSATTDVNSFLTDKFFGHKWNYSDDEIERYGKAYAQSNGIDPNDARVKEAIKYLQNNEGSMIMENSIAKTGWARDFAKGLATPIRGIESTIEDIGKTTADVYAEGQSQGNVNVSEQKIERVKNSWEGTVSDVLEGTGQFVTQAALALGVSGIIGGAGRAILGRAGVAALEGDIALADIGATNLVGKTLLGSKDALATFVTAYGQSYDSNLKQSLTYTADNNKARITANVMSGLEGATELFLSPIAVARGIGRNLFNKATTSKGIVNILSDAAILDKNAAVKNFLKGTIKVVGTEISEEQVVQLADYASNAILNPNSKTFQDRDLMNELANTAYQTGLSMALPALVSGAGAANVNNFSKGSLVIAAQNRQQLLDDMNKRLYDGDMSQDEYNEKASIINTASNANATLPLKENGQKLNSEEKADYIFSRVSEGILTDKVKESADEAEKVILNKKIKNEQNFRTDMLGEKEEVKQPETTTTEPIQVDEDTNVPLVEKAVALLPEDSPMLIGMDNEQSVKYIAEQAQNVSPTGERLEGDNYLSTVEKFGDKLVTAAIEAYPLESLVKPEVTEESGIVVTPPESFPEPITIGEKIEPKVNEPITVSEPSTEVKSEVVAESETPFNDAYGKRIENLDSENKLTDLSQLSEGDYIGIPSSSKSSGVTGFVKKVGRTNVTIETSYGGSGGRDSSPIELTVKKADIEGFYKPKSETKPIQNEAAKVTEDTKQAAEVSEPKEVVTEATQPTKKDIAKEKRIADFNKKADNVGKSIIDLLTPAHTKGIKKSGLGVEEIVNAAIAAIKKANEAGENIKAAIETAIKYIKDNLGQDWNDNFEQPLRDRFEEIGKESTSIIHVETADIREQFGLPEYVKEAQTFDEWDAEADARIRNGEMPALLTKLRNGDMPSAVETRMMGKYIASLKAIASNTKSNEDISKMHDAIKLSDSIGGTETARGLVARKGLFTDDGTLADFYQNEMDAAVVDVLTDEQKEMVEKEHKDIGEAQKKWDGERERLNEQIKNLQAEKEINKNKSTKTTTTATKKTHDDFVNERAAIMQHLKDKLRKARSGTNVTIIPYANDLFAAAPDVARLVKSLVEEGITKLSDVIDNIHDVLIDGIPEVTKDDVRNLIAGVYNPPQKTKSQTAKDLFELKLEAKLINKLIDLENGELPPTNKKQIERNQQIKDLREQIAKFRKENITNDDRLQALKSRYATEIKKVEEDLRTGKFLTPQQPTPPIKLDKAALDAKDKLIALKNERKLRLLREQFKNRTPTEKGLNIAANIFNIPRALQTTLDFSAVLRQGLIPSISHPTLAFQAGRQMFKSAWTQKEYDRWFSDLEESPQYNLMKESGLALTDNTNPDMTVREEVFMSNLAEKIPIVGQQLKTKWGTIPGANLIKKSERAYAAYINKLRVDLFSRMSDAMSERGLSFENSPKQYKQMAEYINNATGRGSLGKFLNNSAPLWNGLFFSPRLIASRLNMLTYFAQPRFYRTAPIEVRKAYFADMAKFISVGLTVLALAKYGGDDEDEEKKITVETDPRSSDFGKIRQGNTRWDIWGGFQPFIRVAAQVYSGERKSTNTGEMYDITGEGAFSQTRGGVLAAFARGKLAPVPSMGVDLFTGRTSIGEKILMDKVGKANEGEKEITIDRYMSEHLLPLTYTGVKEAMEEKGIKALFTVGIPSTFGIGTQTYTPSIGKGQTITVYKDGKKRDSTPEEFKKYETEKDATKTKLLDRYVKSGVYINKYGDVTTEETEKKKKYETLSDEEKKDLNGAISKKASYLAKKKLNLIQK